MSRCIAITGAGRGLGRALARELSGRGNRVVLLGRTMTTLAAVASELGSACLPLVCDVADPASVRAAFAAIGAQRGVLDVLINNAAIYEPLFVREANDMQVMNAIMTNFAGPVYCSRAALPLMQPGGHILNISSEVVGLPHAMFSLYQSSKAGLERFSDALDAELEPAGIRVTLVRAGQMRDGDSRPPAGDAAVLRRFAEENIRRGLDFRTRPISSFASVAVTLSGLLDLPSDLNISRIHLEARRH